MNKCNCIEERRQKLIQLCQADEIVMPVEILSGRIYIEAEKIYTVNGKQKRKKVPILLRQCPFCGVEYDPLEEVTGNETEEARTLDLIDKEGLE